MGLANRINKAEKLFLTENDVSKVNRNKSLDHHVIGLARISNLMYHTDHIILEII
uniref:Uncharacterized protein n=1 Tax=Lepeophtheirus salmonis TaxID=72036 RepID=A0A0K2T738_LEPSM